MWAPPPRWGSEKANECPWVSWDWFFFNIINFSIISNFFNPDWKWKKYWKINPGFNPRIENVFNNYWKKSIDNYWNVDWKNQSLLKMLPYTYVFYQLLIDFTVAVGKHMQIFLLTMQADTGDTEEARYRCKVWPCCRPPAGLWHCAWPFFKPTTLPGFVSSTCLLQGHGILFGLIASHLLVEPELQAQQILFRKAFWQLCVFGSMAARMSYCCHAANPRFLSVSPKSFGVLVIAHLT